MAGGLRQGEGFRGAEGSPLMRSRESGHPFFAKHWVPAFAGRRESHSNSLNSCSIVGRNSLTVGWMCIARAITVQGALAYIWSSTV